MRLNLPSSDDADGFQRHFDSAAWRDAAGLVCARHRIPHSTLRRSPQGENVIFFADERYVVKIYAPLRGQYVRERAALGLATVNRARIRSVMANLAPEPFTTLPTEDIPLGGGWILDKSPRTHFHQLS